LIFVDQHFHQCLIFQKLDMGCPSYESVQVTFLYLKANIKPVQAIC